MSTSAPQRNPAQGPDDARTLHLTSEELVLLRATVAFHARSVSDPALRERLERAASKLSHQVAAVAAPPQPAA